jgi:glycosyltransferase involved in cell wall biosynthesis
MSELISIIMPMRNAQAYVREALQSLQAQANVALEVIVIDDGSTDRSAEIVNEIARSDPRIKMIPGPRKGIAAALNAGLAVAQGEYFCRCDADDWYPADRLAWQLDLMRQKPDIGAVCAMFLMVTASGRRITEQTWRRDASDVTDDIRRGVARTHLCTFMVRMRHVRDLGAFRDYFIGTEDSDFVLRLGEVCRVWYDPRLSYLYRLHGESITHTQPSAQRKFLERTMLQFQQQRLATGQDDLMRGTPPPLPNDLSPDAERTADQIQSLLLGQAWEAHQDGEWTKSVQLGMRALFTRPGSVKTWRSVMALLLKPVRSHAPRHRPV